MEMEVPAYDVAYVAKWQGFDMEEYDAEFEAMFAVEEVTEEDLGDEMPSDEAYLVLNANGGMMVYGSDEPYETDLYTYLLESGKNLGEVMNGEWEDPMKSLEKDGAEFKGWTVYEGNFVEWPEEKKTDLKDGEECFSIGEFMYLVLSDCKEVGGSVSTEDLAEMGKEGKTYYAVANWK